MTRRLRRYLAASALAAALVGVSACDGDGEDPQTTGSEGTSTETTTEPTTDDVTTDAGPTGEPPEVEEPTPPAEMAQDDPVGASATAYYFLLLYDYMRATGDTSAWDALSADACEWCVTQSEAAQVLNAEGGWVESPGLEFDIASADVRFPAEGVDYYTVLMPVTEPTSLIVAGDGTSTELAGRTIDPITVGVEYSGSGFTIIGVDLAIAD